MNKSSNLPSGNHPHCRHCGLVFHPKSEGETFCCAGCEYVYRIIRDEGFERFYDLQQGKGQPVGSGVFSRRDFRWLGDLVREAERTKSNTAMLNLSLSGLSCVGCVWLIERVFSKCAESVVCRVDAQRGRLFIKWVKGTFDGIDFGNRLRSMGYDLGRDVANSKEGVSSIGWRLGVCGALSLNSMLYTLPKYLGMEPSFELAPHFDWLSFVIATLSLGVGGSYFILRAIRAGRMGVMHLDLPIAIGLVFAYGVSVYGWWLDQRELQYFDFVSLFTFLMLVGRWLQLKAVERNRSRLASLEIRLPRVELLHEAHFEEGRSVEEIRSGDRYRIASGDLVPVNSRLLADRAQFGLEWFNGESEPRVFLGQSDVPAGARQMGRAPLELMAKENWDSSLLKRLTEWKNSDQDWDRVAQSWIVRYLLTVMALAFAGFIGWSVVGESLLGIRAFIATLVISCPCSLGIALPLMDELLAFGLRRKSVFVRSRAFWSRFSKVKAIAFDKTGTLTRLNLTLKNPEALSSLDDSSVQALSLMAADSQHPVCVTIREQLMASGRWKPAESLSISEEVGKGIEGRTAGGLWRLGRADWAVSGGDASRTALTYNDRVMAIFEFEDAPRAGALEALEALRSRGLKLSILSGDDPSRARRLGRALNWDEGAVHGGMSPEDKAEWLDEHRPDEHLMVGDGANDRLAFERAGCSGAPAADQSMLSTCADFYYLGDGIDGANALFEAREVRRKTVRELMTFAISYNALAVGAALLGWITPLIAALLMPASSLAGLAIVWRRSGLWRSAARSIPREPKSMGSKDWAIGALLRSSGEGALGASSSEAK